MNTKELKRQCGLVLDLADQNIEELERLCDSEEMDRRTADMRADLQKVWPLIENAAGLVEALREQIEPRAKGWKVTDWDIRDENATAAIKAASP